MRARKKKNTSARLKRHSCYIADKISPSQRPLFVEIGCGKGKFACGVAEKNDCDFYALEKVEDVAVMAIEKASSLGLDNLKFVLADAEDLQNLCSPGIVDVIYLNFSDPWPRNKNAKRRLTYRGFVKIYMRLLKPGGVIQFKTDNKKLFDFSVKEFLACGLDLFDYTENLHESGIYNEEMTEYEQRFSDLGQPIYHVKAKEGKKMILKNATIWNGNFEPEPADIKISGQRIEKIGRGFDGEEAIDLSGYTVVPGFIDMHIHGCGGCDTGDKTVDALKTMSATLVKNGITSFCPTSMTLSHEELLEIFENVKESQKEVEGAYIQGVNMEGPFIAMSKKGAQNGAYVRNPDRKEFQSLYEESGRIIKIVDIAPECDGSEEFIKNIQPYCPVSVAHTAADYDETCKAFELGCRHVTHLYNAQSGLTHRAPGVVGAVFDKTRQLGVRAELICDGFHIHPAALRIAFSVLGEDNSVIVSDSMRAAGSHDGEYDLGGQIVYVKDGKARLEDGTIAASTTNLYEEFKNVISYGIPFKQALKSVTINPAKAIRVDSETGSLEEGKSADILVLDDKLNIKLVIVKGSIRVDNI